MTAATKTGPHRCGVYLLWERPPAAAEPRSECVRTLGQWGMHVGGRLCCEMVPAPACHSPTVQLGDKPWACTLPSPSVGPLCSGAHLGSHRPSQKLSLDIKQTPGVEHIWTRISSESAGNGASEGRCGRCGRLGSPGRPEGLLHPPATLCPCSCVSMVPGPHPTPWVKDLRAPRSQPACLSPTQPDHIQGLLGQHCLLVGGRRGSLLGPHKCPVQMHPISNPPGGEHSIPQTTGVRSTAKAWAGVGGHGLGRAGDGGQQSPDTSRGFSDLTWEQVNRVLVPDLAAVGVTVTTTTAT